MSAKHEWLSLLEVSGPFLAVPVLREVFPQGLEELDSSRSKRLRSAYEEWRDAVDGEDLDLNKLHIAWIDEVLRTALEADDQLLKAGKDVAASAVELPEHDTTILPELVLVDPTHGGAVLAPIHVFPPDTDLSATMRFGGLACSAADRMALHLRALNTQVGIVTNGERWMLVHAPAGQVATFASWYARLWGQEQATLRAFVSLLGVRRCFAPAQERLPALFEHSLKHQDEVTDALGDQVRRAVEVLVQALDRADQDRNRELLRDVKPQELYEAGLTIMMRLVFLLAAEERGLLLLGEPRYDSFYAASTLRMQLRAESDEILERRRAAWSRLLALFRAVYGGIEHPTLRLPAMGGSLFDPDRFPFLEGRLKGTSWRQHRAEPLPIDDRTVLLLLDAIQTLEGRTLSYRALDVEQIGHVYEGLLERTVTRVDDVTLELEAGSEAKNARVTLGELESATLEGKANLIALLVERSNRSRSSVEKELASQVNPSESARLLSACRGDVQLRDRLEPYARLVRVDPWGYPLVHPKGAFVVVLGADRRETGTHYTPTSLTERVVEATLTPLVYDGPASTPDRNQWKLKTSEQILNLKVCDPAMGSGAFLVQACRFLSGRLVEAWAIEEAAGRVVDVAGRVHSAEATIERMPPSVESRAVQARSIVAERCLYGVDINSLAVELSKLSLWLVTLSKGRPFGFLDHNLRHGDSLLGITRLEQLTKLSLEPAATLQGRLFGQTIERAVAEAVALRRKLRDLPIRDIRDVEAMASLDSEARSTLQGAEALANEFINTVFTSTGGDALETSLAALAGTADRLLGRSELAGRPAPPVNRNRALLTFHWPLQFPDVFEGEGTVGFDAIVGNPPYLGGKRITTIAGPQYNAWLAQIHSGASKNTDLVAHFFRSAFSMLRADGVFGFVTTNSITDGDTREGGLGWLLEHGAVIYSATPNEPWPGRAAVVTSTVHIVKGKWNGGFTLSGRSVASISSFLTEEIHWIPQRLVCNSGRAFIGSYLNGIGFVIDRDEADRFIASSPQNSDVVFPYLIGKDITSNPTQSPSRWVINFWDWSDTRAQKYAAPFHHVSENVQPQRATVADSKKRIKDSWWIYEASAKELYHSIGRGQHFESHPVGWRDEARRLDRVLVLTRVSRTLAFCFVSNTSIFSEQVVVFSTDKYEDFGLLQSSVHSVFAWQYSGKMKDDLRYSPTDAFLPFPYPPSDTLSEVASIGSELHASRESVMVSDQIGLTDLYHRIHDAQNEDHRLVAIRGLHQALDRAVVRAYGWGDVPLDHGFHSVAYLPEHDRTRYAVSEAARAEILRRLTAINKRVHSYETSSNAAEKKRRRSGRKSSSQSVFDLE